MSTGRLIRLFGGSSPLAQGLPRRYAGRPVASGIIPARAGFTVSAPRSRRHSTDHPRSRGVYAKPVYTVPCTDGSSPLARGLRTYVRQLDDVDRIIPARAGFTSPSRRRYRGHGDHPRSRGVYRDLCEG